MKTNTPVGCSSAAESSARHGTNVHECCLPQTSASRRFGTHPRWWQFSCGVQLRGLVRDTTPKRMDAALPSLSAAQWFGAWPYSVWLFHQTKKRGFELSIAVASQAVQMTGGEARGAHF